MRLWDKGQPLDAQVASFTTGDDPVLDLEWAAHDLVASKAHVVVLGAAGLLTPAEVELLRGGLDRLLDEVAAGTFSIPAEEEDVHTAIEARLGERLGPVAGKLHTGRSRNDQVLTALRLWMRDQVDAAAVEWNALAEALLRFAEANDELPLTGYTHLQRAMPSSYALWAAGFAAALLDLRPLLDAAREVVDRCPLGSAAGYGTPLPLDRALSARILGFARVEEPVTTAQLTRGSAEVALLGALAAATGVVTRLAWDISLFTTSEFALLRLPEAFTTGSSIMPQKRNPDVAELLRATSAQVRSARDEIEQVMLLPSGYHRDAQLTKAPLVRGVRAGRTALRVSAHLVGGLVATPQPLEAPLYAAAEAYRRDRPFREAYREVAAEIREGRFVAEPAPAPPVDIGALRARLR